MKETIDQPTINSRNREYSAKSLIKGFAILPILFLVYTASSQCNTNINNIPYSEDFESSVGLWTQDAADDFDWTRHSGSTGSGGTGPSSGNNGSSWYMYTEASNPNYPTKTANLLSPCINISGPTGFNYAYHMYGTSGMGAFNLDLRVDGSSTWINIWNKTGNQGNQWNDESINLTGYDGQTIQLRFSVTTNTYRSDVAIDDVSFGPFCDDPVSESFDACSDASISGDVSANEPLPAGSFGAKYTVSSGPTKGVLNLNEDGSFSYTPNAGASGADNFTYERCYTFIEGVDSEVILYNPCGTGLIIDSYIEGIENESNPSIKVDNITGLQKIIVEVWAESACGSVTIEGVTATQHDIYRTDGTLDTEKIYRATITSVSSDNLINISKTGGCTLSSAAAYVERVQASALGSSSLYTSDIDLFHTYVPSGDDCFDINIPIGGSSSARDVTFTIPLHEKDNTRLVTAKVTAGSVVGSGSTTSYSAIGQGAGIIVITLNNVPGNVSEATVQVCSPENTGDSFGVGVISSLSLDCSEPATFDCCATATATININNLDASVQSLGNPCQGNNTKLRANETGGSGPYKYNWSGPGGYTSSSKTINVSSSQIGTYTVTITDSNDCEAVASGEIYPSFEPSISSSDNSLCVGESATLTLSGANIQAISWGANAGNSSAASVIVSPTTTTTYTVTATSVDGCQATESITITVNPNLTVSVDYNGSVCLENDSQLSAIVSGGTANFNYQWTGPNGFTANQQTVDISESGNYSVTVTDSNGCTAVTSGVVYDEFDPYIFTLDTEICEGESVDLSVNGAPNIVSYQWDSNAGNSSSSTVTVLPTAPSSTYVITVTNDKGCVTTAFATINVIPKDNVSVTGDNIICVDETTTLSPTTGGTWQSSNTNIATVTPSGIVTAVGSGSVTFVFLNNATDCESDATAPITIQDKPVVSVTGSNLICGDETTTLSPTTGGIWYSSNEGIATVSNNGIVTPVTDGIVSFTFKSNATDCISDPTVDITIYPTPTVSVSGSANVCVGTTTNLNSSTSGDWTSSNDDIATVTATGIVTGVSAGTVSMTFLSDDGCSPSNALTITVDDFTNVTLSGGDILCEGETASLTASHSGGTWSSSNSSIATVNSSGVVTAIGAGIVNIEYSFSGGSCYSDASISIEVREIPDANISGSAEICEGETSQVFTNATGGYWTSLDESVAIVSATGVVSGIGAGSTRFFYTAPNGCPSDTTGNLIVNPSVEVSIDFNGSVCLTDESMLSAIASGGTGTYTYSWSGPGGFIGNVQTVDISIDGNYYVTVTDSKGCAASTSAFVYEAYEPFIFTLNTTVCEGEDVALGVNGSNVTSYEWNAAAGNATTQAVTVTPSVPSTAYTVTVTNNLGCSTEATADISVDPKPIISISGAKEICVGENSQMNFAGNGIWTSSNSSVATISNSGLITATGIGTAIFTFEDGDTGCDSDDSEPLTVSTNAPVFIDGQDVICISDSPTFTASEAGGSWLSENTNVAMIDASGQVIPVAAGNALIRYVVTGSDCYADGTYNITIHNNPTVSLNGPSTICEGDNTYVSASVSGTWSTSDPAIAIVSSTGVITGKSGGSVIINYESIVGCTSTLSTPITIIEKKDVALTGPAEICIDENTSLSPTSGGIWISSNNNVATVSSNGIVTAKGDGIVTFSFIESTNGCLSDETITITVNAPPSITGLSDNALCIGETATITPNSGGTWTSTNDAVATISEAGVITAVAAGTARFIFTNNLTGCSSVQSAPLTINGNPEINFTGPTTICKGETTAISPTTGGQWYSNDVSKATIEQNGVITAVNSGTVTFSYVSDLTGCISNASEVLTIEEPVAIELTGPSSICIGDVTNMSPTTGGIWTSSNTNIATISNNGQVVGNNPGYVTFTYNSTTGCSSDPSVGITVEANPVTSFAGPSAICIGSTTSLIPNTGGVWASSNDAIATVNNEGEVTAEGVGTALFTYTSNATGCSSNTPISLSVYEKPVPIIIGDDEICVGSNTFLSPNTGGVWTSSNNNIATITNTGQVTAVSAGTVTFTFYESGSSCISDASDPVTIYSKTPVSIVGDNTICVDEATTLSPNTGGSWISNNPSVASVTNSGIVTGVSQGIAKFIFVSDAGCESNETSPIIVFGAPSILISGPDNICINEEAQMLPVSGGTWVSSNPLIAEIDDDGLVTAIATGVVNFTFTDSNTGCTSEPSDDFTVNTTPNTGINGPSEICIGAITYLTPSTGGVWTALDPEIATIQNNGQVTGVAAGNPRFIFTQLTTGCESDVNTSITVSSGPAISITGPKSICEGETTTIIASSTGTWESTNPLIASITNSGIITGNAPGAVKFRFTDTTTGCKSELSETLTVNGSPSVSRGGSSLICIGSTTFLIPNTGGVWESLNPAIASVSTDGIVTGVAEGSAYFRFTDNTTGCVSDGSLRVDVASEVDAQITGDAEICAGYTTTLSPTSGGVWTSSDPSIATVSNFGVVTGRAPGIVTFSFVDAGTGCSAGGTTDPVTVSNCLNHDFNVALVAQTIMGDLSTNDNMPLGATYSNIKINIEKPLASLPQLTINSDGTYSFETNKPGKYIYKVSVCMPPMVSGCPSAFLEINVIDNVQGQSNPVSNLEFATTYADSDPSTQGQQVNINPLANDRCVYTAGCDLDISSMNMINNPANGDIAVSNGIITYTPDGGFIGYDTLEYQVCVDGELKCSNTMQIITVNAPNALNSVVAADDFTFTMRGQPVTGNLILNDLDPEGDNLIITQQGSLMSPVVIAEGEYYVNTDGTYSFTPNDNFSGALDIVYTLCDDNVEVSCTNATLHIQVFDDLALRIRVYIEGALMHNEDKLSAEGKPLMRDGLRVSPYTGKNYIPQKDPYTYPNELFDETPSMFTKVGPGLMASNLEITDSVGVFSVAGDNAIVDWVHVELRAKHNNKLAIATRSGLLQRDGDVVDLDGKSPLRFQGINADSFYVCVRHRTHLGVMSDKVMNGTFIDFTSPSTPMFNYGISLNNNFDYSGLSQKSTVKSGYMALWGGDFNSDGKLKFSEPASDINILYGNVLFSSAPSYLINYDFSYGYYRGDYNMDGKAKYANPNDDKNYLQAQIIFHPLNINYISNLDGVIQQIP